MNENALLYPPHPRPLPALPALARVLWHGDGNLLELLPAAAYRFDFGDLGYSRRSTVLFNRPDLCVTSSGMTAADSPRAI